MLHSDLLPDSGIIPSKIFEAMASGLPVLLAAPKGEASRIVEADGAGICVPAEDPEAMAIAARQLMDDGPGLKALADQSLAAATRHSREAQARHMADVLERAAARRGVEASSVPPGGA